MNPLVIIVGVFLFVSGIVLGRQSQSPSSKILNFTKQFEPSTEPTPTPTLLPTPTQETQEGTPSSSISPSPNKQITPNPTKSTTSTTNLVYPNSSVSSQSDTEIRLSSQDNTDTITSWYEEKLTKEGYTARAIAKTATNGNVLNKLSGGKSGKSVSIEIQKTKDNTTVTITIRTSTNKSDSSDVQIHIEEDGYL